MLLKRKRNSLVARNHFYKTSNCQVSTSEDAPKRPWRVQIQWFIQCCSKTKTSLKGFRLLLISQQLKFFFLNFTIRYNFSLLFYLISGNHQTLLTKSKYQFLVWPTDPIFCCSFRATLIIQMSYTSSNNPSKALRQNPRYTITSSDQHWYVTIFLHSIWAW